MTESTPSRASELDRTRRVLPATWCETRIKLTLHAGGGVPLRFAVTDEDTRCGRSCTTIFTPSSVCNRRAGGRSPQTRRTPLRAAGLRDPTRGRVRFCLCDMPYPSSMRSSILPLVVRPRNRRRAVHLRAARSRPSGFRHSRPRRPADRRLRQSWWRADVGIRGDRIVAVGRLADRTAALVIDAKDRVVGPGFIDVHSHALSTILPEPSRPRALIAQGVTTVVGNPDGGDRRI